MCPDHCRARMNLDRETSQIHKLYPFHIILFYLSYVCVVYAHTSAVMCTCGRGCSYTCAFSYIYEGQVQSDIKCLPRLLPILSLETGSLIQLGAHQLGVAGTQVSSRKCTGLHLSNTMMSYQTCAKMHSVYIGDVDLNLHNMPEQQILYLLGHHPSPLIPSSIQLYPW